MKAIILAAGQGSRLRPITNDIPKCMALFNNKPLLEYQLEVLSKYVKDLNIVTGYLQDKIDYRVLSKYENLDYESTNMVYTLFCAESIMDDDLIIAYGDIIYNEEIIKQLVDSEADLSVVVDRNWREYWSIRMENPLADAETLKINTNGKIFELGKKANSYDEIEGQYIGLIKISKHILPEIISYYHNLDKNIFYDNNDFKNMYMTSFLQLLSDNICELTPVFIHNGWLEIDTVCDLNIYHKMYKEGTLSSFYR